MVMLQRTERASIHSLIPQLSLREEPRLSGPQIHSFAQQTLSLWSCLALSNLGLGQSTGEVKSLASREVAFQREEADGK